MSNTWIAIPVISNDVDLTSLVQNLSGGYVAPETYETTKYDSETNSFKKETMPHPYAGQNGPDFSNKIIFINYVSDYNTYSGVVNIEDFEDLNIYRGWNKAIDYATENGADSVILMNGALDLDTFVIKDAIDVFNSGSYEIINISDGAILLISTTSSIKPDDQFQIWFGDNDLYRRAENVLGYSRSEFFTMKYLIEHSYDEAFNNIVKSDELKYNAKWS